VTTGNRRVISATCTKHAGAWGFTNLVITRRDGNIELDPHATGACVVRLDESGARDLCETLMEWLAKPDGGPDGGEP
jgi:hypothetical protein